MSMRHFSMRHVSIWIKLRLEPGILVWGGLRIAVRVRFGVNIYKSCFRDYDGVRVSFGVVKPHDKVSHAQV